MASVGLQAGHVYRRRGATGAVNEQPVVEAIARMASDTTGGIRLPLARVLFDRAWVAIVGRTLADRGHRVVFLTADRRNPPDVDLFIASHCDGSTSSRASGASFGHPTNSTASRRAGQVWQQAYAEWGWPFGFRPINYTPGLEFYYYYRRIRANRKIVVEHGFNTNPANYRWITSSGGLTAAVNAIVDTVGAIYGHPTEPTPLPPTVEDADVITPGSPRDYIRDLQRDIEWMWANLESDQTLSVLVGGDLTPDGLVGGRWVHGHVDDFRVDGVLGSVTWTAWVKLAEKYLSLEHFANNGPYVIEAEARQRFHKLHSRAWHPQLA